MRLMLRRAWGVALVAMLAVVASFAGIDTVKAQSAPDYYRGYTTSYPSEDGPVDMYRVAAWNRESMGHIDTNDGYESEPAFCFNMDLQPPSDIKNSNHVEYQRSFDLRTAADKGPETTPRIDDSAEFTAAVVKVIYNGFGYDASSIKERYGLTQNEFYIATQHAVWYYTDSRFGATGEVPTASRLAGHSPIRVGEAAQAMLGFGDVQLVEPPKDATLTVYNTDMTYRDGRQFQNLLTVTIRHGEDGPPIEKPGAPSIATQVKVDGNASSAEAPAQIEATTQAHVIDTVSYQNFEAGKEYTFKGELVDLSEGNKVVATAEVQHVVENSHGTVDVDFGRVDNLQSGHTYVVFESAMRTEGGVAVECECAVEHKDPKDKAQTFVVSPKPEAPAETDKPEAPSETDKPEAPAETDKPEAPAETPSVKGGSELPTKPSPAAAPKSQNKSMLANTGVNATLAIVAGTVLLGVGFVLMRRSNRA